MVGVGENCGAPCEDKGNPRQSTDEERVIGGKQEYAADDGGEGGAD